jgi:hypothetical protein
VISARFLLQDENVMTGQIMDFQEHSVLLGECVGPLFLEQSLESSNKALVDDSIPAHVSNVSTTPRSFVLVVKSSRPMVASSLPEAPPGRWRATCSSFHDGSRSIQAFLLLRPQAKRLVLIDMNEEVMDARFLLGDERVHSALILDLRSHTVVVGESFISDSLELGAHMLKSTPSNLGNTHTSITSEVAHKDLAFDLSRGVSFEATCKSKFGHSVTLANSSHRRAFLLVASFGRACFKLDVYTVAITLQSCFGGNASSFKVLHLRDRTFQFSVASRAVRFEIYNQIKVCTPLFELFFKSLESGWSKLVDRRK